MAKSKDLEHIEQAQVIEWARVHDRDKTLPGIEMLYAIPNGGLRDIRTAVKLKNEGVRAGVPDLCLPVAMGGDFGLYIEMKIEGGKVSPVQGEWITRLVGHGYCVAVCWNHLEAIEMILNYLRQDKTGAC